MGGDRALREGLDLGWLGDVDAVHADLARTCALAISAATACSPASSRSASARSQPRAASSSASARPMPLAAPVTATAAPRIAVMCRKLHVGQDRAATLIRLAGFGNRARRRHLGAASSRGRAMVWAAPCRSRSSDRADRRRLARHRRALHAGGGADPGIAGRHRRGVRLHARDRSVDVRRHARAGRGHAHQRAGVRGAEMVRGGLSALHGAPGAARAGGARGRGAGRCAFASRGWSSPGF